MFLGTRSSAAPTMNHDDLHLPRILCLHGGGTNARIFRAQCRSISAHLKGRFRLCFAQAPLPSEAGPDVLSVYREWGPFRAWIPSPVTAVKVDSPTVIALIKESLESAMHRDDHLGSTGPWVGVLGFSQGAKVCASLLLANQLLREKNKTRFTFRFGILLAGRGPLLALDPSIPIGGETVIGVNGEDGFIWPGYYEEEPIRLHLPTVHVHGLQDPGLHLHRRLLEDCCEEESTRLMEWNGNHRVPIKTADVAALVEAILAVAKETGVQVD
jgi:hypothetical protein